MKYYYYYYYYYYCTHVFILLKWQSARLEIWSSEVGIPIQIRILLLKSKIVVIQGTNDKFVSIYQFDLKRQNN